MTERHTFILSCEDGLFTMTKLCHRLRVSRNTSYKWLGRYRTGGIDALRDRPRAPERWPHRTPERVCQLLIEA
jgi:transposase